MPVRVRPRAAPASRWNSSRAMIWRRPRMMCRRRLMRCAICPKMPTNHEVRRGAWRDQVTDVVITGPVSVEQLGRFADELVARLFAVGITRTSIQGLAASQTLVEVPSVALMRHDVTMAEIASAIAAEVRSAPAGDVGGGASRVRTGREARAPADIAAIVLRSAPDGTKLTIGDLAEVRLEGVDRGRAYFVGDNPAMTVRVDRNAEGDAIRMQAQVAEVAAEMQPQPARRCARRSGAHPGRTDNRSSGAVAGQWLVGAGAGGGAAVLVSERAHGSLGGGGHSGFNAGRDRDDVCGGLDAST